MPALRLQKALRALPEGAQVTVIADDPVAVVDIPYYCRQAGHHCTPVAGAPRDCVFLVTRGPNPA